MNNISLTITGTTKKQPPDNTMYFISIRDNFRVYLYVKTRWIHYTDSKPSASISVYIKKKKTDIPWHRATAGSSYRDIQVNMYIKGTVCVDF